MAGRPAGDQADGRQRLLDACWELLVATVPGERITIAQVCERAGVTPPTLYHHFGDLGSLEEASSRQAFRVFNAEMMKQVAAIRDPRTRMRTHGYAYATWARKHPDAYSIMFCRPSSTAPTVAGPGLSMLIANLARIHDLEPNDPRLIPVALAHWSLVHGMATLQNSTQDLDADVVDGVLDYLSDLTDRHLPEDVPDWALRIHSIREETTVAIEPPRRRRRTAGIR